MPWRHQRRVSVPNRHQEDRATHCDHYQPGAVCSALEAKGAHHTGMKASCCLWGVTGSISAPV